MTIGVCSGWYMASTSSIPSQYNGTMGIIQNSSNLVKGFYRSRFDSGVPFCIDNEVFSGKFQVDTWLKAIELANQYKSTCLFVVIPDVLHRLSDDSVIGDCVATLEQFHRYREMVKDLPVALVSQDGIYKHADKIPWNDFDCLFVGGSDTHKLGMEGGWIIQEAKARGKWVHVGRVNSVKRIKDFWQADSWDGTHLGFYPSDVKRFHNAVLEVREKKQKEGVFHDLHSDVFSGNRVSQPV